MKNFAHFLFTLVVYTAFDLAWLNLFAKKFIQQQVGSMLAARPDLIAGGVFYLIFAFGMLWFCVWPAQSPLRALLNGALFGLVTYGTYELVNKALIDRWPLPLVVVDIAWGVFVGMLTSWMSYKTGEWLKTL